MASDIPARAYATVREEGTDTGEVFFRPLGVNLVFDFVVLELNSEKADAVNAACGGACTGVPHAELKPERVAEIGEQKQSECREHNETSNATEGYGGIGGSGRWGGHEFGA